MPLEGLRMPPSKGLIALKGVSLEGLIISLDNVIRGI